MVPFTTENNNMRAFVELEFSYSAESKKKNNNNKAVSSLG